MAFVAVNATTLELVGSGRVGCALRRLCEAIDVKVRVLE
jgi:phosphoglycerate dehydrogenase-like enzyme